jgi:hypothetical protein
MAKYQLIKDGSNLIGILKKEDIAANTQVSIPIAPGNTDYEEYLEWAKSNTADPADVPSDWDVVKEKRDRLLKDSDWTMTTGATVDQAQWSAYREKLRDIPQTYKGKATSEIVWPTAPSTKGPNS